MTKRRLCHCDTDGYVGARIDVTCQHDAKLVRVARFERMLPPSCNHPDRDWSHLPRWTAEHVLHVRNAREMRKSYHQSQRAEPIYQGGYAQFVAGWAYDHPGQALEQVDVHHRYTAAGWRVAMECPRCSYRLVALESTLSPILDTLAEHAIASIALASLGQRIT